MLCRKNFEQNADTVLPRYVKIGIPEGFLNVANLIQLCRNEI